MIIFKDLLEEDQELFTDEFPKNITVVDDFLYKVPVKQINKPSEDLSGLDIGANKSAEDDSEEHVEDAQCVEKVLDLCHSYKLHPDESLAGDKKFLKKIVKAYLTTIANKLKEDDPDAAAEMKKTFVAGYKSLQDKIDQAGDNLEILVGERFEVPDEVEDVNTKKKTLKASHGMGFGIWNDDGVSLEVYFIKAGLIAMKV